MSGREKGKEKEKEKEKGKETAARPYLSLIEDSLLGVDDDDKEEEWASRSKKIGKAKTKTSRTPSKAPATATPARVRKRKAPGAVESGKEKRPRPNVTIIEIDVDSENRSSSSSSSSQGDAVRGKRKRNAPTTSRPSSKKLKKINIQDDEDEGDVLSVESPTAAARLEALTLLGKEGKMPVEEEVDDEGSSTSLPTPTPPSPPAPATPVRGRGRGRGARRGGTTSTLATTTTVARSRKKPVIITKARKDMISKITELRDNLGDSDVHGMLSNRDKVIMFQEKGKFGALDSKTFITVYDAAMEDLKRLQLDHCPNILYDIPVVSGNAVLEDAIGNDSIVQAMRKYRGRTVNVSGRQGSASGDPPSRGSSSSSSSSAPPSSQLLPQDVYTPVYITLPRDHEKFDILASTYQGHGCTNRKWSKSSSRKALEKEKEKVDETMGISFNHLGGCFAERPGGGEGFFRQDFQEALRQHELKYKAVIDPIYRLPSSSSSSSSSSDVTFAPPQFGLPAGGSGNGSSFSSIRDNYVAVQISYTRLVDTISSSFGIKILKPLVKPSSSDYRAKIKDQFSAMASEQGTGLEATVAFTKLMGRVTTATRSFLSTLEGLPIFSRAAAIYSQLLMGPDISDARGRWFRFYNWLIKDTTKAISLPLRFHELRHRSVADSKKTISMGTILFPTEGMPSTVLQLDVDGDRGQQPHLFNRVVDLDCFTLYSFFYDLHSYLVYLSSNRAVFQTKSPLQIPRKQPGQAMVIVDFNGQDGGNVAFTQLQKDMKIYVDPRSFHFIAKGMNLLKKDQYSNIFTPVTVTSTSSGQKPGKFWSRRTGGRAIGGSGTTDSTRYDDLFHLLSDGVLQTATEIISYALREHSTAAILCSSVENKFNNNLVVQKGNWDSATDEAVSSFEEGPQLVGWSIPPSSSSSSSSSSAPSSPPAFLSMSDVPHGMCDRDSDLSEPYHKYVTESDEMMNQYVAGKTRVGAATSQDIRSHYNQDGISKVPMSADGPMRDTSSVWLPEPLDFNTQREKKGNLRRLAWYKYKSTLDLSTRTPNERETLVSRARPRIGVVDEENRIMDHFISIVEPKDIGSFLIFPFTSRGKIENYHNTMHGLTKAIVRDKAWASREGVQQQQQGEAPRRLRFPATASLGQERISHSLELIDSMSFGGFPFSVRNTRVYHSKQETPTEEIPPKDDFLRSSETPELTSESLRVFDPRVIIRHARQEGRLSIEGTLFPEGNLGSAVTCDLLQLLRQEMFLDYVWTARAIARRAYEELRSLGHCHNIIYNDDFRDETAARQVNGEVKKKYRVCDTGETDIISTTLEDYMQTPLGKRTRALQSLAVGVIGKEPAPDVTKTFYASYFSLIQAVQFRYSTRLAMASCDYVCARDQVQAYQFQTQQGIAPFTLQSNNVIYKYAGTTHNAPGSPLFIKDENTGDLMDRLQQIPIGTELWKKYAVGRGITSSAELKTRRFQYRRFLEDKLHDLMNEITDKPILNNLRTLSAALLLNEMPVVDTLGQSKLQSQTVQVISVHAHLNRSIRKFTGDDYESAEHKKVMKSKIKVIEREEELMPDANIVEHGEEELEEIDEADQGQEDMDLPPFPAEPEIPRLDTDVLSTDNEVLQETLIPNAVLPLMDFAHGQKGVVLTATQSDDNIYTERKRIIFNKRFGYTQNVIEQLVTGDCLERSISVDRVVSRASQIPEITPLRVMFDFTRSDTFYNVVAKDGKIISGNNDRIAVKAWLRNIHKSANLTIDADDSSKVEVSVPGLFPALVKSRSVTVPSFKDKNGTCNLFAKMTKDQSFGKRVLPDVQGRIYLPMEQTERRKILKDLALSMGSETTSGTDRLVDDKDHRSQVVFCQLQIQQSGDIMKVDAEKGLDAYMSTICLGLFATTQIQENELIGWHVTGTATPLLTMADVLDEFSKKVQKYHARAVYFLNNQVLNGIRRFMNLYPHIEHKQLTIPYTRDKLKELVAIRLSDPVSTIKLNDRVKLGEFKMHWISLIKPTADKAKANVRIDFMTPLPNLDIPALPFQIHEKLPITFVNDVPISTCHLPDGNLMTYDPGEYWKCSPSIRLWLHYCSMLSQGALNALYVTATRPISNGEELLIYSPPELFIPGTAMMYQGSLKENQLAPGAPSILNCILGKKERDLMDEFMKEDAAAIKPLGEVTTISEIMVNETVRQEIEIARHLAREKVLVNKDKENKIRKMWNQITSNDALRGLVFEKLGKKIITWFKASQHPSSTFTSAVATYNVHLSHHHPTHGKLVLLRDVQDTTVASVTAHYAMFLVKSIYTPLGSPDGDKLIGTLGSYAYHSSSFDVLLDKIITEMQGRHSFLPNGHTALRDLRSFLDTSDVSGSECIFGSGIEERGDDSQATLREDRKIQLTVTGTTAYREGIRIALLLFLKNNDFCEPLANYWAMAGVRKLSETSSVEAPIFPWASDTVSTRTPVHINIVCDTQVQAKKLYRVMVKTFMDHFHPDLDLWIRGYGSKGPRPKIPPWVTSIIETTRKRRVQNEADDLFGDFDFDTQEIEEIIMAQKILQMARIQFINFIRTISVYSLDSTPYHKAPRNHPRYFRKYTVGLPPKKTPEKAGKEGEAELVFDQAQLDALAKMLEDLKNTDEGVGGLLERMEMGNTFTSSSEKGKEKEKEKEKADTGGEREEEEEEKKEETQTGEFVVPSKEQRMSTYHDDLAAFDVWKAIYKRYDRAYGWNAWTKAEQDKFNKLDRELQAARTKWDQVDTEVIEKMRRKISRSKGRSDANTEAEIMNRQKLLEDKIRITTESQNRMADLRRRMVELQNSVRKRIEDTVVSRLQKIKEKEGDYHLFKKTIFGIGRIEQFFLREIDRIQPHHFYRKTIEDAGGLSKVPSFTTQYKNLSNLIEEKARILDPIMRLGKTGLYRAFVDQVRYAKDIANTSILLFTDKENCDQSVHTGLLPTDYSDSIKGGTSLRDLQLMIPTHDSVSSGESYRSGTKATKVATFLVLDDMWHTNTSPVTRFYKEAVVDMFFGVGRKWLRGTLDSCDLRFTVDFLDGARQLIKKGISWNYKMAKRRHPYPREHVASPPEAGEETPRPNTIDRMVYDRMKDKAQSSYRDYQGLMKNVTPDFILRHQNHPSRQGEIPVFRHESGIFECKEDERFSMFMNYLEARTDATFLASFVTPEAQAEMIENDEFMILQGPSYQFARNMISVYHYLVNKQRELQHHYLYLMLKYLEDKIRHLANRIGGDSMPFSFLSTMNKVKVPESTGHSFFHDLDDYVLNQMTFTHAIERDTADSVDEDKDYYERRRTFLSKREADFARALKKNPPFDVVGGAYLSGKETFDKTRHDLRLDCELHCIYSLYGTSRVDMYEAYGMTRDFAVKKVEEENEAVGNIFKKSHAFISSEKEKLFSPIITWNINLALDDPTDKAIYAPYVLYNTVIEEMEVDMRALESAVYSMEKTFGPDVYTLKKWFLPRVDDPLLRKISHGLLEDAQEKHYKNVNDNVNFENLSQLTREYLGSHTAEIPWITKAFNLFPTHQASATENTAKIEEMFFDWRALELLNLYLVEQIKRETIKVVKATVEDQTQEAFHYKKLARYSHLAEEFYKVTDPLPRGETLARRAQFTATLDFELAQIDDEDYVKWYHSCKAREIVVYYPRTKIAVYPTATPCFAEFYGRPTNKFHPFIRYTPRLETSFRPGLMSDIVLESISPISYIHHTRKVFRDRALLLGLYYHADEMYAPAAVEFKTQHFSNFVSDVKTLKTCRMNLERAKMRESSSLAAMINQTSRPEDQKTNYTADKNTTISAASLLEKHEEKMDGIYGDMDFKIAELLMKLSWSVTSMFDSTVELTNEEVPVNNRKFLGFLLMDALEQSSTEGAGLQLGDHYGMAVPSCVITRLSRDLSSSKRFEKPEDLMGYYLSDKSQYMQEVSEQFDDTGHYLGYNMMNLSDMDYNLKTMSSLLADLFRHLLRVSAKKVMRVDDLGLKYARTKQLAREGPDSLNMRDPGVGRSKYLLRHPYIANGFFHPFIYHRQNALEAMIMTNLWYLRNTITPDLLPDPTEIYDRAQRQKETLIIVNGHRTNTKVMEYLVPTFPPPRFTGTHAQQKESVHKTATLRVTDQPVVSKDAKADEFAVYVTSDMRYPRTIMVPWLTNETDHRLMEEDINLKNLAARLTNLRDEVTETRVLWEKLNYLVWLEDKNPGNMNGMPDYMLQRINREWKTYTPISRFFDVKKTEATLKDLLQDRFKKDSTSDDAAKYAETRYAEEVESKAGPPLSPLRHAKRIKEYDARGKGRFAQGERRYLREAFQIIPVEVLHAVLYPAGENDELVPPPYVRPGSGLLLGGLGPEPSLRERKEEVSSELLKLKGDLEDLSARHADVKKKTTGEQALLMGLAEDKAGTNDSGFLGYLTSMAYKRRFDWTLREELGEQMRFDMGILEKVEAASHRDEEKYLEKRFQYYGELSRSLHAGKVNLVEKIYRKYVRSNDHVSLIDVRKKALGYIKNLTAQRISLDEFIPIMHEDYDTWATLEKSPGIIPNGVLQTASSICDEIILIQQALRPNGSAGQAEDSAMVDYLKWLMKIEEEETAATEVLMRYTLLKDVSEDTVAAGMTSESMYREVLRDNDLDYLKKENHRNIHTYVDNLKTKHKSRLEKVTKMKEEIPNSVRESIRSTWVNLGTSSRFFNVLLTKSRLKDRILNDYQSEHVKNIVDAILRAVNITDDLWKMYEQTWKLYQKPSPLQRQKSFWVGGDIEQGEVSTMLNRVAPDLSLSWSGWQVPSPPRPKYLVRNPVIIPLVKNIYPLEKWVDIYREVINNRRDYDEKNVLRSLRNKITNYIKTMLNRGYDLTMAKAVATDQYLLEIETAILTEMSPPEDYRKIQAFTRGVNAKLDKAEEAYLRKSYHEIPEEILKQTLYSKDEIFNGQEKIITKHKEERAKAVQKLMKLCVNRVIAPAAVIRYLGTKNLLPDSVVTVLNGAILESGINIPEFYDQYVRDYLVSAIASLKELIKVSSRKWKLVFWGMHGEIMKFLEDYISREPSDLILPNTLVDLREELNKLKTLKHVQEILPAAEKNREAFKFFNDFRIDDLFRAELDRFHETKIRTKKKSKGSAERRGMTVTPEDYFEDDDEAYFGTFDVHLYNDFADSKVFGEKGSPFTAVELAPSSDDHLDKLKGIGIEASLPPASKSSKGPNFSAFQKRYKGLIALVYGLFAEHQKLIALGGMRSSSSSSSTVSPADVVSTMDMEHEIERNWNTALAMQGSLVNYSIPLNGHVDGNLRVQQIARKLEQTVIELRQEWRSLLMDNGDVLEMEEARQTTVVNNLLVRIAPIFITLIQVTCNSAKAEVIELKKLAYITRSEETTERTNAALSRAQTRLRTVQLAEDKIVEKYHANVAGENQTRTQLLASFYTSQVKDEAMVELDSWHNELTLGKTLEKEDVQEEENRQKEILTLWAAVWKRGLNALFLAPTDSRGDVTQLITPRPATNVALVRLHGAALMVDELVGGRFPFDKDDSNKWDEGEVREFLVEQAAFGIRRVAVYELVSRLEKNVKLIQNWDEVFGKWANIDGKDKVSDQTGQFDVINFHKATLTTLQDQINRAHERVKEVTDEMEKKVSADESEQREEMEEYQKMAAGDTLLDPTYGEVTADDFMEGQVRTEPAKKWGKGKITELEQEKEMVTSRARRATKLAAYKKMKGSLEIQTGKIETLRNRLDELKSIDKDERLRLGKVGDVLRALTTEGEMSNFKSINPPRLLGGTFKKMTEMLVQKEKTIQDHWYKIAKKKTLQSKIADISKVVGFVTAALEKPKESGEPTKETVTSPPPDWLAMREAREDLRFDPLIKRRIAEEEAKEETEQKAQRKKYQNRNDWMSAGLGVMARWDAKPKTRVQRPLPLPIERTLAPKTATLQTGEEDPPIGSLGPSTEKWDTGTAGVAIPIPDTITIPVSDSVAPAATDIIISSSTQISTPEPDNPRSPIYQPASEIGYAPPSPTTFSEGPSMSDLSPIPLRPRDPVTPGAVNPFAQPPAGMMAVTFPTSPTITWVPVPSSSPPIEEGSSISPPILRLPSLPQEQYVPVTSPIGQSPTSPTQETPTLPSVLPPPAIQLPTPTTTTRPTPRKPLPLPKPKGATSTPTSSTTTTAPSPSPQESEPPHQQEQQPSPAESTAEETGLVVEKSEEIRDDDWD